MQVTASAPASTTDAATSMMRSVFALSFAHRGRPQPAVAAITSADSVGVVSEDRTPPLEVGTRQVHLDRDDLRRCGRQQFGRTRRSRRRCDPRCWPRPWRPTRRDRRPRGRASTARRDPGDRPRSSCPAGSGALGEPGCRATRTAPATWSRPRRATRDRGTRRVRCRSRRSPMPSSPGAASSTLPTRTRVSITVRSPPTARRTSPRSQGRSQRGIPAAS